MAVRKTDYKTFICIVKTVYEQDESGDFVKVSETCRVIPRFWLRLQLALKLLFGDIQGGVTNESE